MVEKILILITMFKKKVARADQLEKRTVVVVRYTVTREQIKNKHIYNKKQW